MKIKVETDFYKLIFISFVAMEIFLKNLLEDR